MTAVGKYGHGIEMADDWDELIPLGSFALRGVDTLFDRNSCGYVTARDSWVVNYNNDRVSRSVQLLINNYNQVAAQSRYRKLDFTGVDDTQLKWTDRLKEHAEKGAILNLDKDKYATSLYRP